MNKTELCSQYFKDAQEALKNKYYTKALYLFKYIVEYFPKDNSSNYLYGNTCLEVGDYRNAIIYIEKTQDKFKDELFYNKSLAKSYEHIDLDKAQFFYEKILTLSDNSIQGIEMLALFYQHKKKDFKLANDYFLLGLDKFGNKYNIAYNIGVLHQENKLYDKAIEFFNLAKENKENLHSIYNNLGNCYLKINKIHLAILMFKKSINHDRYFSSSYLNLGALYKKLKRYKSALWVYNQGLKGVNAQEILWQMSLLNILMGDFKNGLEFYETRLLLPKFKQFLPTFSKARWQRENITNKILLISTEQGFGDIIFFSRYIKYVLLLNPKKVIILAPKELEIILSMDEKIEIILENDKNIEYDYYCYIMSLAYLFYEDDSEIPNQSPYLACNKKIIDINVNKNKFNIFIVWHTDSDGEDVKDRNIDLALFSSLFDIENIDFYSLMGSENKSFDIKNISSNINDFNDTAIILGKMDLVVSIDTAIAHLAGSLNIPCFVILPFNSNWRWGLDDNTVSYYPSIRLFRGDKKYGFNNLFSKLETAIKNIIRDSITIDTKINSINIESIIKKMTYVENLNAKAIFYLENKQYDNSLRYSTQSIFTYKNPLAFMNIALVYLKTNEFKKALLHFRESISLQENDESYFNLGVCFVKLKNAEKAINAFENSIRLNPLNIQPKHNLAFTYAENNMNLKSIEINLSILDIDLFNIRALESLSFLFDRELDDIKAKYYYDILFKKDNISSQTKLNMASFYFRNDECDRPRTLLLSLISDNVLLEKAHQILGNIYKKELNQEQAITHYKKSIALNKDDKTLIWNLGFLYLSTGDYLQGFSFIEKRYETNLLKKKEFLKSNKYNNENLNNKTLFIYMEQGLGDNVLLVRYIEMIKSKYPQSIIYLSSRNELVTLFKGIKSIDKIFDIEDINESYDYHISLFSMPFIFKTTLKSIPNTFPYIFPKKQKYDLNIDNNFLNIAIVWKAGDKSTTQEERSICLESFKALSENKKIKLFSLQKGDIDKEKKETSVIFQDLSSKINDFNDTANIMLELDLIISVDTAAAHLAGALNKKCFVILPEDTNWRWGFKGDKSPWFNSIKLFRMNSISKQDVFAEIEKEVSLLI